MTFRCIHEFDLGEGCDLCGSKRDDQPDGRLSFEAMTYFNIALGYYDRLSKAETIIGHILATAPWDSHEAHLQLLKEARAYFAGRDDLLGSVGGRPGPGTSPRPADSAGNLTGGGE